MEDFLSNIFQNPLLVVLALPFLPLLIPLQIFSNPPERGFHNREEWSIRYDDDGNIASVVVNRRVT